MAVVEYSQQAPLSGFYSWLQAQGLQSCLVQGQRGTTLPQPQPSLPAGAYAQAGSLIRYSVLTTLSSVTVYFRGQFQTETGQWQNVGQVVVGTSAGGIDRSILPATAGWYSNMVATVDTAVVANQECYVLVELGRIDNGVFLPYAVLLSGYITTNFPIDSQAGPQQQNPAAGGSTGGGGCCMTTLFDDVFDPDDGVYTVVVPSGANGRLIQTQGTLTCDANVANRTVNLQLNPASGFGWQDTNQNLQTATQTKGYLWQVESSIYTDIGTGTFVRGLPSSLWFSGNFTVEVRANNIQAGDDFSTWDITYEIKGP